MPFPVAAREFDEGGSPTPVPPSFTTITLELDPAPPIVPAVTWNTDDARVAYVSQSNPSICILTLPGDTEATPAPQPLRTFVIPAVRGPALTWITATIGAPVNGDDDSLPFEFSSRRYKMSVEALAQQGAREPQLWITYESPARTLLFRTRDGRYVKWLIQNGDGLSVLAGPYQVL